MKNKIVYIEERRNSIINIVIRTDSEDILFIDMHLPTELNKSIRDDELN